MSLAPINIVSCHTYAQTVVGRSALAAPARIAFPGFQSRVPASESAQTRDRACARTAGHPALRVPGEFVRFVSVAIDARQYLGAFDLDRLERVRIQAEQA